MTKEKKINLTKPYKFLDYYGLEDSIIFYGRKQETELLLNDITSTRLVVLFSKTGTGKTSLINAGVIPRLTERFYKTLYIRVEKDPTESIRKALKLENLLSTEVEKESLAVQLENAVEKAQKPIVLFIDQFEEFFIYILNEKPQQAYKFIKDISILYHNSNSGVHVVFSMREEFFVEMDIFRDEIAEIFHKETNLRLRNFTIKQARDAIILPLVNFGIKIDEKLVEKIINDIIEKDGRIEPIKLQIVCDTLWKQKSNGIIRLEDYKKLGGAKNIINLRLEADIEQNLTAKQLQLFEKLLPELKTEHNTKYVRGFNELVKTLDTDKASLRKLVNQLQELRLIRESTQFKALYIEWMSDYIANRTDYLKKRVRIMFLLQMLHDNIKVANIKRKELAQQGILGDSDQIKDLTENDLELLFYETILAIALEKYPNKESEIRNWIEKELITPLETREYFLYTNTEKVGIPQKIIDSLIDLNFIQIEKREGARLLSLSHIRSIKAIIQSNRQWQLKQLKSQQLFQQMREKKYRNLFYSLLIGVSFIIPLLIIGFRLYFPTSVSTHEKALNEYLKGKQYFNESNYEKAEDHLLGSLQKEETEEASLLLAKIYINLNEFNRAIDQFNKTIQLAPQSAEAYYELGKIFIETGEEDEGYRNFIEYFKLDKRSPRSVLPPNQYAGLIGYYFRSQINSTDSTQRRNALSSALELARQRVHYTYMGKTPESGFDCTGFISYILKKALIINNEESFNPENIGVFEPTSKPKPMDLMFFPGVNNTVLFYLGDFFSEKLCIGIGLTAFVDIVNVGELNYAYSFYHINYIEIK